MLCAHPRDVRGRNRSSKPSTLRERENSRVSTTSGVVPHNTRSSWALDLNIRVTELVSARSNTETQNEAKGSNSTPREHHPALVRRFRAPLSSFCVSPCTPVPIFTTHPRQRLLNAAPHRSRRPTPRRPLSPMSNAAAVIHSATDFLQVRGNGPCAIGTL